ncbi:MAG TPA: hypothetical protein VGY98_08530 [Verrucomicrobiae bacterium]|nr:hypothetical protein [Verrucomicrobiae bacterium]
MSDSVHPDIERAETLLRPMMPDRFSVTYEPAMPGSEGKLFRWFQVVFAVGPGDAAALRTQVHELFPRMLTALSPLASVHEADHVTLRARRFIPDLDADRPFTKFDKAVVVDFNDKLEAHLKDMHSRRDENSPWVFPSPRLQEGPGYFANPQKLLNEVTLALGIDFHLHDLRRFFISYCVMSGIDALTVASWAGHTDGGKLIFSTYGYLHPQHKRDAAAKLQFTPQETTTRNPNLVTLDLSKMSTVDLLALLHRQCKINPTG